MYKSAAMAAEAEGNKALSITVYLKLGSLLGDLNGDYPQAIEMFKKVIAIANQINDQKSAISAELKLGVAYLITKDDTSAKQIFDDLAQKIDLSSLPIYPTLQPFLDSLNVKYKR